MAKRASVIACIVQSSFALAGLTILDFFGISVPAFRIAGGLIVSRVSFEMLRGSRALKVTPEERTEGAEKDDISITPLAIPLLCGPGSITTGILLSSQATTWLHTGILLGNTVIIYVLIYVLLRVTSTYTHLFGETSIKIVTRLMGLLLLAMAVQFIVDGLHGAGLAPGAPVRP
jgi:multiple antibiotic resistance protein